MNVYGIHDYGLNEYDLLLEIFRFIRDYSTTTYTLSEVFQKVLQYLKDAGYPDAGYPVKVIDDSHADFKTLQVGEHHRYKIIRHPNWVFYEVKRTL